MQPSPRKFSSACHRRAGTKSTNWFARRSPTGERHTRNRRITASCTVTDSRIRTGTFGSWLTWSRAQLGPSDFHDARREHMQPTDDVAVSSKAKLWTGRLITFFTGTFFLHYSTVKLPNAPELEPG